MAFPEHAPAAGSQPPAVNPAAGSPGTGRRRRGVLSVLMIIAGLCGLAASAVGIAGQLEPRTFTSAQRQRIMAWEVASRWRVLPVGEIFPARVSYRLPGDGLGTLKSLALTARRLAIARQASCARGAGRVLAPVVDRRGCRALLRATYADATTSFVLTVGVAVLKNEALARSAARDLASGTGRKGAEAARLLLQPLAVPGSAAAAFGARQRQLSWVDTAGPYLIVATVGFADGRPRVPVSTDSFANLEMTSLAGGIDAAVARPLGRPPPVPHCPGGPGC